MRQAYKAFLADLPDLVGALAFDADRIPYVDFERIIARWLVEAPATSDA